MTASYHNASLGVPPSESLLADLNKVSSTQTSVSGFGGEAIKSWLINEVSRLMLMPHSAIDTTKDLEELGLDSQETLELVGALEKWLSRRLPQTLVAECGSIMAIAAYLAH